MDSAFKRTRAMNKMFIVLAAFAALMTFGMLASSASAHADDACTILLTPPTADNPLNTTHTVYATVTRKGGSGTQGPDSFGESCKRGGAGPLQGITVTFTIVSGPHAGVTGTGVTDANGVASFTWTGTKPGTDVIVASFTNENVCDDPIPPQQDQVTAVNQECASTPYNETVQSNQVVKNWLPDVIITQAAPAATIALAKRCQSRKFNIRTGYTGAEATTATLSIDGKKIKTLKLKGGTQGAGIFTVNSGKYKSGSHRIRIVTKYTNGAQIVKTGKFSRCAVRTAARRVSPQFTG